MIRSLNETTWGRFEVNEFESCSMSKGEIIFLIGFIDDSLKFRKYMLELEKDIG